MMSTRDMDASDMGDGLGEMLCEHLGRYRLSRRETEVAICILGGDSNKQAARKLDITESTVKFHLGWIYKKTGVKTRFQLRALIMGEIAQKALKSVQGRTGPRRP